MALIVAAAGDPLVVAPIVRRHIHELDGSLPLFQVRTFDEVAARSLAQRRFTMTLLGAFAIVALLMAAAGIYGVMAHLVSLRTPEIGVRLALGATRHGVMQQVLREAVTQAVIGLVIGLAASFVAMRGLRAFLYGVEPTDPLTIAAVTTTLLVVAALAVVVPAFKAMRIDPITALRAG